MSCDYLIDQALFRVWSSPRQDTQSITKPKKITGFNGAFNKVRVLHDEYALPVKHKRFHVYQVGQLYPLLMGFFPRMGRWMTLMDNCNRQNGIVNIYNDKGIEMPRYSTWYLVTESKNLLIAVEDQPTIDIDLNVEPLYLRVYSNAYFHRQQHQPDIDFIKVTGKTVETVEAIVNMKDEYEKVRKSNMGMPFLYINGRKSNILNLNTVKRGDCVEFIQDTSVYRFIEFKVSNLRTFDSIKDLKRKYLLHYNTPLRNTDQIDYNDDIDVYIVRKDPNKVKPEVSGFYYHRNQQDAMRNVTHRDYSIAVPYVDAFTKQEVPVYGTGLTEWYVQVYIRRGGLDRDLTFVHDRIKELYKLPDRYVVNALMGIDSVVDEWRADNLENSAYMRVLAWPDYNLVKSDVEDMFGYNAVSKMVGDTPQKVEMYSGRKTVKPPFILRRYATGFEYDKDGRYLTYYNHVNGERYSVRNTATELVEMIGGYGSQYIDETWNRQYSHHDKDFNYRFYKREKKPVDGILKWVDVTGSDDYRDRPDVNAWEWLIDFNEYDCVIRSDKNILVQDELVGMVDGLLYVQMMYLNSRTGVAQRYKLDIPLSEIDVMLNGYSLVEGVDYYIDFPNVCIINKAFLIQPARTVKQRVTIRQYGFPDKDFKRQPKEDIGFVRYGTLSRNNRFDIRDDRVMRINVGGRLIHRDDLGFSEVDTAIHVPGIREGHPYEIKDVLVPFRNLIDRDHFQYRLRSQIMDNKVSAYMTRFVKDPVKTNVSAIPERWEVVSPFCSKIIFDLINGVLSTEPLKEFYDDNFVLAYTQPYEYLLRVDPTQEHLLYDDDFVIVHPTPVRTVVSLNPWQYKFVERVVSLILKNRVDLSSFARIVP